MNLREMKKAIMIELAMMTWKEPVFSVRTLHNLNYTTIREFLEWKLKIRTKAQKKRFEEAMRLVQVTMGR
jgi:hypothetical protein